MPLNTTTAPFKPHIIPPPITIGDYTAEIRDTGVQVGCTFVPWETIETLLKHRPASAPAAPTDDVPF